MIDYNLQGVVLVIVPVDLINLWLLIAVRYRQKGTHVNDVYKHVKHADYLQINVLTIFFHWLMLLNKYTVESGI